MYTRMLIPLDGSKTAEKVLPYARYLAGRLKTPVELMAVIDMAEFAAHMPAGRAPVFERMIESEAGRSATYLRGIAEILGGIDATCTVEKGRPGEVIAGKSEPSSGVLIAMTTHGRSGLKRFLMGSVTEEVLRAARNGLLIVHAGEETETEVAVQFKTIIVPLDGSEFAATILPTVAGLAKALGAEVILFRAYRIPYNDYGAESYLAGFDFKELLAEVADEAERHLEENAAELRKLGVEKVSCVAKEGLSADEIIAFGRKNPGSLIAMSSHGSSGVKRWMLGSVTENVVRHARSPVLIVRPISASA